MNCRFEIIIILLKNSEYESEPTIVRDITREDEKYWWDKENNVLYRYQNNPNIKNKK